MRKRRKYVEGMGGVSASSDSPLFALKRLDSEYITTMVPNHPNLPPAWHPSHPSKDAAIFFNHHKRSDHSIDVNCETYEHSISFMSHFDDENDIPLQVDHTLKTLDAHLNNLILKREFSQINLNVKNTDTEALLTILKYNLSVGILTLPSMFFLTGYILGTVLILGVTVLTGHSVGLLHEVNLDMWATSPEHSKVNVSIPYDEMCRRVLGEVGRLVFRSFSMLSNIGACMAYIIFFEMYIAAIIRDQWSSQLSDEETHFIGALIAFVLILPLSTINNVALFWQTNIIGLFLCLTALLLMLYKDCTLILETGFLAIAPNTLWRSENFTLALGITVYSFKIVSISMTIRNNMAEPINFKRIFYIATAITSFIFLVFGIVAELALGEYAADVALMNYAPFTLVGFLVRLAYIMSVLLSYPLTFYVVVILYESIAAFREHVFSIEKYENREYGSVYSHQLALIKRYAVRYACITLIFMVSLNSVKFSKLISFIGSLGGIWNQFLIPQLLFLVYFRRTLSVQRIVLGIIIIAFCLIASCMGTIQSARELFQQKAPQKLE